MNSKEVPDMNPISRRNFITRALVILSSSIAAGSVNSHPFIELESLQTNASFEHECFIVYQEWKRREQSDPLIFLQQALNNPTLEGIKISELTQKDFQKQNFFPIEGLLLGKTEAAFLALLGSNVTC